MVLVDARRSAAGVTINATLDDLEILDGPKSRGGWF